MAKAISINQFYNNTIEEIISSINTKIIVVPTYTGYYELRLGGRVSTFKSVKYSPERGLLELVAGLNRLTEIPDLGINIDPRGEWVYMTIHLQDQWRWMTSSEWRTLRYLRRQVKYGSQVLIGSRCWRKYVLLKRRVEERYGGYTAVGVGAGY